MEDYKIKRVCGFSVSSIHFSMMILPYINKELEKELRADYGRRLHKSQKTGGERVSPDGADRPLPVPSGAGLYAGEGRDAAGGTCGRDGDPCRYDRGHQDPGAAECLRVEFYAAAEREDGVRRQMEPSVHGADERGFPRRDQGV